MENKIKICWGIGLVGDGLGNAYGYTVHNRLLYKHLGEIAEFDNSAKNVVSIISPEQFKPVEGRTNWLFTMFEGDTIPEEYMERLKKADYLLAPSTWVKEELFGKFLPEKKCFVVNHGVEPVFKFRQRHSPNGKPFRYLWVGAPNPRKGWEEIIHAWNMFFKDRKDCELYIKTTRVEKLERNSNVILDGRNLPIEELVKLYHTSHCFVFPTRGEGFGLTLAEAMRTGLPCIATKYSGVTDFFDDNVGYTINYTMGKGKVTFISTKKEVETGMAFPLVDEMVARMLEVKREYKKALLKGKKAYIRIASKFTWERSANTLLNLIREYGDA